MSLDKSRISKLSDSSRKFIPERQKNSMNDHFVEKTKKTTSKKRKKVPLAERLKPGVKACEEKRKKLEAEIHRSSAQDGNQAGYGTEGNGIRRLTSDSTPVEQGHDIASSTGTLEREENSELSNFPIKKTYRKQIATDRKLVRAKPAQKRGHVSKWPETCRECHGRLKKEKND